MIGSAEIAKNLKCRFEKDRDLDSYPEKYVRLKIFTNNGFDSIQYLNEVEDPKCFVYDMGYFPTC